MYNLDGLKHMLCFSVLPLLIIGLILILFYTMRKKRRKKSDLVVGIIVTALALLFSAEIIYNINNPQVLYFDGTFIEEHTENTYRGPFVWRYTFYDGSDPKQLFYLDSFTKKKIFNDNFETNKKYRIYYEDNYKIIVKVEEKM